MEQKRATISRRARVIPSSPRLAEQNGSAVESLFTNRVRERLDGRVLSYDNRRKLLKLAEGMGIERFRANLLIAMAQHGEKRMVLAQTSSPTSQSTLWFDLSAALLIQGFILLLACWLWTR